MPPSSKPFPRFIADSSQEGLPYGRWAELLAAEFARACESLAEQAGAPLDAEAIRWFPERGYGGRFYVPAAARSVAGEGGEAIEYFGHVSFERAEGGGPGELRAKADFTDVLADENPDWQIDLNDDVIGTWQGDAGRGGEMTLVWGSPLIRGAMAATAELDGETLDQAPLTEGRFTLVAVDAVTGFGDDLYLAVKLWDRRLRELASESLYDEPADDEPTDDEQG